jgi:hypothetical protein
VLLLFGGGGAIESLNTIGAALGGLHDGYEKVARRRWNATEGRLDTIDAIRSIRKIDPI